IFHYFFFTAEDGIRDLYVTGVQTCALPILPNAITGTRWSAQTRTACCTSCASRGHSTASGGSTGSHVVILACCSRTASEVMIRSIGRASCRERGESLGGAV